MGLELVSHCRLWRRDLFRHWLFQVWCHSCNTPSLGLLYRGVVFCICLCWIPSVISGTRSEGCLSPLELWFGHQGMIILGTAWCHLQIFLQSTPARQVSHWCIWRTRLDLTHCLGGCRWVFQPMSRACRLQSLVVFFWRENSRSRSGDLLWYRRLPASSKVFCEARCQKPNGNLDIYNIHRAFTV